MYNHILFVHVPKTAGTSFRIAAEEYFGKEHTFFDYSPQNSNTSSLISELIYKEKDFYKLHSILVKHKHSFLSGHFPVQKYAPLYDTLNVVTFVREPVAQVFSHYTHYKNLHGYKKSLREFVLESRFQNVQSKLLDQKPLEYYGFIGITEEYNTSIDLFNAVYGTQLKKMHINKKSDDSLLLNELDEEMIILIQNMNPEDIKLYKAACKQFEIRKHLHKKDLLYTHVLIQKSQEKQISGVAFQSEISDAVEINVYAGKEYLTTILAKNLRPGQITHNVPRKGFVGFDYIHTKNIDSKYELHASIKSTGQQIILSKNALKKDKDI